MGTRTIDVDLDAAQVADSQADSFLVTLKRGMLEIQKKTVLVLGFTGSGKTSLLKNLFGATVPEEPSTLDVNKYVFRLGKTKFICVDTPGHPTVQEALDAEIDSLVGGDYQGVISVVSYGYNQSGHRGARHSRYKPVLSGGRINQRYLNNERSFELDYLKAWARVVRPKSGLEWVLTVANKADLWFRRSSEVLAYYTEDGDYAKILKQDLESVKRETLPLVATVGGFFEKKIHVRNMPTSRDQQRMKSDFANTLYSLLS